MEKKNYSKPYIIEIGNIVDITFGGSMGWGGDSFSTKDDRDDIVPYPI